MAVLTVIFWLLIMLCTVCKMQDKLLTYQVLSELFINFSISVQFVIPGD